MKIIDIVILSFAKSESHYNLTMNCLKSLYDSKLSDFFNVVVIESKEDVTYNYKETKIVHLKESFNYNKFANYGASLFDSGLIGVFNNDVIFNENWILDILTARDLNYMNTKFDLFSCSPISLTSKSQLEFINLKNPIPGYGIAKHLSGWAIILSRKLHKKICGFDVSCSFWCSDDAYSEQLKQIGVTHYLIPTSIVNHVGEGSNTLKTMDEQTKNELTYEQAKIFNKKYNANKFNLNKPS